MSLEVNEIVLDSKTADPVSPAVGEVWFRSNIGPGRLFFRSSNGTQDLGRIDNRAATGNPGANDDSGDGYTRGSRWIDVTNDIVWECVDPASGAAVWKPISQKTVIDNASGETTYTSSTFATKLSVTLPVAGLWRFVWSCGVRTDGSGPILAQRLFDGTLTIGTSQSFTRGTRDVRGSMGQNVESQRAASDTVNLQFRNAGSGSAFAISPFLAATLVGL